MAVTEASEAESPPDRYELWGHETIRRPVKTMGELSHAMVPVAWMGDHVKAVRLTRGSDEEPSEVYETDAGRYAIEGHSILDKEPGPVSGGSHIYLPDDWAEEVVQIVRVTKEESKD